MVIFSLLIAILIDRATRARGHWQLRPIAASWHKLLYRHTHQQEWAGIAVVAPLLWIAPAILLALILALQGSALLLLIVNVLVLLIALGCAPQRDILRMYLSKGQSGHREECVALQAQLNALHPELSGHGVGAHIIWLNFRYYFAVAFWFIVLGAAGALAYALIREYVVNRFAQPGLTGDLTEDADVTDIQPVEAEQAQLFARILYVIEWPAARVAGFAYLLVGHFSRAMPVWLNGLGDIDKPHSHYLAAIASRAEEGSEEADEMTQEPCVMMTLAKRSMVLLLAATALATLLGWLS